MSRMDPELAKEAAEVLKRALATAPGGERDALLEEARRLNYLAMVRRKPRPHEA